MIACSLKNELNEKWELTPVGQVRHIETGMCLDHRELSDQEHLVVRKCDPSSKTQRWEFSH